MLPAALTHRVFIQKDQVGAKGVQDNHGLRQW